MDVGVCILLASGGIVYGVAQLILWIAIFLFILFLAYSIILTIRLIKVDSLSRLEYVFPRQVCILLSLAGLASCFAFLFNYDLLFTSIWIGVQLYALVVLFAALKAKNKTIFNYAILVCGFAVFIGNLGDLMIHGLPPPLSYVGLTSLILLGVVILAFLFVILTSKRSVHSESNFSLIQKGKENENKQTSLSN